MKRLLFICLLTAVLPLLEATDVLVWDFTRPQPDWGNPRRLETCQVDDGLELRVTGEDSSLANTSVRFSPRDYRRFLIEYKATGFVGSTHGELFFGGESNSGALSDANRFFVPPLVVDGQWHILEFDAKTGTVGGEESWLNMRTVTHLRLDLVNECPGTIILLSVAILPPRLSPLTRLAQTSVSDGVLLPREMLEHGALPLQLPSGQHRLWLRRNPSMRSLPHIWATPALVPAKASVQGNWTLLG